jgi:hypothetical protein
MHQKALAYSVHFLPGASCRYAGGTGWRAVKDFIKNHFCSWFRSAQPPQMRKDIHQFSLFYFPRRLDGIPAGNHTR